MRTSKASTFACIGVCGYLIGATLPLTVPFDLPLAFLVVLTTLAVLAGRNELTLARSPAVLGVLGFAATRLASALVVSHAPGNVQSLAPLLPALLLFVVLSEWVETRHVAAVCVCLTIAGFVLATTLLATSWLSASTDADAWALAVASPMLVVKNDVTVVAILAPLALALASLRLHRLVPVAVIGFFGALLAVIAVVRSRTALLTTVVAVVTFVALTGRWPSSGRARVRCIVAGVGVLVAAFAVDALVGFRFVHKLVHDWQGSGRLALWAAALAMFGDAPLLGHGPGSYGVHYRAYLDALHLPSWIDVDPRLTSWAHNLYLELLAEQGVVGLVAFLALGVMGLAMVNRMRARPPDNLQHCGAAVGAGFIALLVAAFLELSFLRAWVTILLFTLLGLLTALTRSAPGSGPCKAA